MCCVIQVCCGLDPFLLLEAVKKSCFALAEVKRSVVFGLCVLLTLRMSIANW